MTEFGGKALSVKKVMSGMKMRAGFSPLNVFKCKFRKLLNSIEAFLDKSDYLLIESVIRISSL